MPCQEETCKECNESSTHSTPFVSAPSSPRKSTSLGYYLQASATLTVPASSEPHDLLGDAAFAYTEVECTTPSLSEFEFSSRFSEADAWFNPSTVAPPMSTAEELFYNGKIRPLNTRLCPPSYCICFSDSIHHDGYHDPHFYDTCYSCAYRGGSRPAHADHHQQHLLMRNEGFGHTKATSALSALEQWKKSMGRYEREHSRHANGHHVERVMQIPSMPLACYRNRGGGHHRRARSLSPLRVFHMDDMMMEARGSFESENMYTKTKISHAIDVGTIMRPRRSRKSWTLKELLNMGDNKMHDKRPQLQGNFSHVEISSPQYEDAEYPDNQAQAIDGSLKSSKDHNVGKILGADERLYSKSSTNHKGARSPWSLQKDVEELVDPCYSIGSQRAEVEEMSKRSFQPHKKGLLGCLGFTSKLSSINKGLHAMQH